jgi:hypothetical protein
MQASGWGGMGWGMGGGGRRSGIQVFRLYVRPSPVTEIANDKAGLRMGGGGHRENVSAACRGCVVVLVSPPDYNFARWPQRGRSTF